MFFVQISVVPARRLCECSRTYSVPCQTFSHAASDHVDAFSKEGDRKECLETGRDYPFLARGLFPGQSKGSDVRLSEDHGQAREHQTGECQLLQQHSAE